MTIVLPALAVAFAAFCVWLTVRIVNRLERWAKWTAVGLAVCLPVLYVLSVGPAVWLVTNDIVSNSEADELASFYNPLSWLVEKGPTQLGDGINWYADLWRKPATVEEVRERRRARLPARSPLT